MDVTRRNLIQILGLAPAAAAAQQAEHTHPAPAAPAPVKYQRKIFDDHQWRTVQVLSDLIMAGLDGKETICRIREIEPGTKALYMSGYMEHPIVENGGINPAVNLVQKPFTPESLVRKVRAILEGAVEAVKLNENAVAKPRESGSSLNETAR